MKQGTSVNRIVMLLLFAAIVIYLGGAVWKGLRDPYPTVPVYEYAVEDTVETTGYLVRREQVLNGSLGIVRLTPGEGEKVAAGATVALLYADQLSLERSDRLTLLENEVEQLTAAIEAAGKEGKVVYVLNGWTRFKASADFLLWFRGAFGDDVNICTLPQSELFIQASAAGRSVVGYGRKKTPAGDAVLAMCDAVRGMVGFPPEQT